MKKLLLAAGVIAILSFLPSAPAGAYDFYLDDLLITKDNQTWYSDSFENGTPPPMGAPFIVPAGAPDLMGNYIGNGYFSSPVGPQMSTFPMGSEAGGKLHFDSQYAALAGVTVPGYTSWIQNARLRANQYIFPGPVTPYNYLLKSDVFSVSARYDLIAPAAGEVYALRLYDPGSATNSPSGGLIELRVRKAIGSSQATVQFRRGDYILDGSGKVWLSVSDYESDKPLDLTHGWDQIILFLDHPEVDSTYITAYYQYYDKEQDIYSDPVYFDTEGQIFTYGQLWTDVEFQAGRSQLVPEPMSLILLGFGLAGLAVFRRKTK